MSEQPAVLARRRSSYFVLQGRTLAENSELLGVGERTSERRFDRTRRYVKTPGHRGRIEIPDILGAGP